MAIYPNDQALLGFFTGLNDLISSFLTQKEPITPYIDFLRRCLDLVIDIRS